MEKYRGDFPILEKKISGKPIIYFDNACLTLKPKQVVEAMNDYYYNFTACGGRSMHRFANQTTEEVDKSRRTIRKFINARKDEEVIFTRNTTEGINLVANSFNLQKGDLVLLSDKEHNSNLVPWLRLAKEKGIVVKQFEFGNEEDFKSKVKGAKFVSTVHTSNLDGTTQDVKQFTKIAHKEGAKVMIDAAQSTPHKDLDVKSIDADFVSFSGHKMLGPTGTGIFYGKKDLLEELPQFMVGGETVIETFYDRYEQEKLPEKFEAGLQDYAGIIGLGAAIKYLEKIKMRKIEKHEQLLNKTLTEQMPDNAKILGGDFKKRSGILSFYFPKVDVHQVSMIMDRSYNIMMRSGAHCVHSWFNANNLEGSDRASLYFYNTEEECNTFAESLKEVLKLVS